MVPLKLKLENFLSYKEAELDFTKLDAISLIVGEIKGEKNKSNGSGKSSLFEAITFALFGQCRVVGTKNVSIDDVIRWGQDSAVVEFIFEIDKDQFSVTRSRSRGRRTTKVNFSVWTGTKWKALGDRKKDTDKEIVKRIGLDYTVFSNSVYFKQGEVSAFAEMTSGERKEVVKQLIQIDRYEEYATAAKSKYEVLIQQSLNDQEYLDSNENVEELLSEVVEDLKKADIKVSLYQKDVAICKKKIKDLQEQVTKDREKALTKISLQKEIKQILKDLTNLNEQEEVSSREKVIHQQEIESTTLKYQELTSQFNDLVKKTPDARALKIEMEKVKKEYALVEKEKDKALEAKSKYEGKVKEIETNLKKIDELGLGKCITCFADVTEKSKDDVKKQCHQELAHVVPKARTAKETYEEQLNLLTRLDQKIANIRIEADEYNRIIQEKRLIKEKLQNQETVGTSAKLGYEKAEESLKKAIKDRGEKTTILNVKKKELKELEEVDPNINQNLHIQIGEEETKVEKTNSLINEVSTQKGLLIAQKDSYEKIKEEVVRIKTKIGHIQEEQQIYKELAKIFGKNGIQALILENSSVEIEQTANMLLADFTDGAMSISIETLRKNKTDDNYQEVFDIKIRDGSRIGLFETFSGGEKFKVAFAIRIALSMLLAKRSGVQIPFVLYDEAFSDLDQDSVDKLVDIFSILIKYFALQLVITHTTELKDKFGSLLTVKKSAEGSMLVY